MISTIFGILGIIVMLLKFYIDYHNRHRGAICFLDFLIIIIEYAAYFTGGIFLYKICAIIWCLALGSDCALLFFTGKHK